MSKCEINCGREAIGTFYAVRLRDGLVIPIKLCQECVEEIIQAMVEQQTTVHHHIDASDLRN